MIVLVEKKGAYAVITMKREPVNLMNTAFWESLSKAFQDLEADPKVRGVIFQSGLSKDIFTAGNDIKEIYAPLTSKDQHFNFWVSSNTFLAQVYRSKLITISAIRGACPAAGCILSLCCDYRVMTSKGYIGLNEPALGIPVPKMWIDLMVRVVGHGPGERLTQFGLFCKPQEAFALGMVDKVVKKEELLETAENAMKDFLKIPDEGRQITKSLSRDAFSKEWERFCALEAPGAWEMLNSDRIKNMLGMVIQKLSQRKSKI